MKTRFGEIIIKTEVLPFWRRWFKSRSSERGQLKDPADRGAIPRTKGKILVVDDDLVTLKALSFKLKSRGYTVSVATDYAEAMGVLRGEPHEIILLDVYFPRDVANGGGVPWDGFRIINWVRNFKELAQIPIILMSASVEPGLSSRAKACGAVDLLRKPVDSQKLLDLLELCLLARQTKSGSFDI